MKISKIAKLGKVEEKVIKQKVISIDPPQGWRWGFPKYISVEEYGTLQSIKEWCIKNGYPKEEADSYEHFFIRIIYY
jgi:hypothetical protein